MWDRCIDHKRFQSWSRYNNLIDDSNTLLNNFQSWNVNHVKREANMAYISLFGKGDRLSNNRRSKFGCDICVTSAQLVHNPKTH